jgi:hypothetical protein
VSEQADTASAAAAELRAVYQQKLEAEIQIEQLRMQVDEGREHAEADKAKLEAEGLELDLQRKLMAKETDALNKELADRNERLSGPILIPLAR